MENKERRSRILTEEDKKDMVEHLLKPENIDKFAEVFETRWRNYFYRGLGHGIIAYAWRGFVYILCVIAGYGFAKDWHIFK